MDPFGYDADQYAAAAAWVSVLVLIATGLVVWRQLKVSIDLRRDQARPFVVPSIDIEQRHMLVLRIENIGSTPAVEVRFDFDTPPRSSLGDIENLRLLREGIPYLPPGQVFRCNWDLGFDVLGEKYEHPTRYDVTVTYAGPDGHPYGPERYPLDFGVFAGQATGAPGMPELVDAVEKLTRKLGQ